MILVRPIEFFYVLYWTLFSSAELKNNCISYRNTNVCCGTTLKNNKLWLRRKIPVLGRRELYSREKLSANRFYIQYVQ